MDGGGQPLALAQATGRIVVLRERQFERDRDVRALCRNDLQSSKLLALGMRC